MTGDTCTTQPWGYSWCRNHCAGLQGKFVPIGRWNEFGTLYARTELAGDQQYYIYQQQDGNWEFSWQKWITPDRIDYDNFGNCKFYKLFYRILIIY